MRRMSGVTSSVVVLFAIASVALAQAQTTPDRKAPFLLMWRGDVQGTLKLLDENPALVPAQSDTGQSLLHVAARAGSVEMVKYLLDKNAIDIDQKDSVGAVALYEAVKGVHTDVAALLLDHGAKLIDGPNATLLALAAQDRSLAMVRLLLSKGANPNQEVTPHTNHTLLHDAADRGRTDLVKLLLDNKADPNVKDVSGVTPVSVAAYRRNGPEIVALLKAAGGKENIFDAVLLDDVAEIENIIKADPATLKSADARRGMTPLHFAVMKRNKKLVQLLLAAGADPNARMKETVGGSPLDLAIQMGDKEMQTLLQSGGAKRVTSGPGATVSLLGVASRGQVNEVKALLDQGADVNARDEKKRTPLQLAAHFGHTEVVRLLLEHKAEVEPKDSGDQTPLWHAAGQGNVEMMNLLVEAGADVNCKTWGNETALFAAVGSGSVEAVKVLIALGADLNVISKNDGGTPLLLAVKRAASFVIEEDQPARVETVKLLLASGADMNAKDREGHTVLSTAIQGPDKSFTALMMQKAKQANAVGEKALDFGPALVVAVGAHNLALVNTLLEDFAAGISQEDLNHALKIAAQTNRPEEGVLLLTHGADVNARENGYTPLHWAAHSDSKAMVELLLAHGATVNFANQEGKTPLAMARGDEVRQILLKAGGKLEPDVAPAPKNP